LGSHLEDAGRRKRDGADRLAQEARASAPGLDQRDLQVRAKTREHDSRETSAAAAIDDKPRPRDMRGGCERVDGVVAYQTRQAARSGQVNAAVPDREQVEEASQAVDRAVAHVDTELACRGMQEPDLRRRHARRAMGQQVGPRLGARPKIPDRAPRSRGEEAGHGTTRKARAGFRGGPRPGSDGDRPRGDGSESWVTLLVSRTRSPAANSGASRPTLAALLLLGIAPTIPRRRALPAPANHP